MKERYCMYLRKSRKDDDPSRKGESIDETLARHYKSLEETAQRLHLNVEMVYKEVVSGDSIDARPVMQQLLQEVQNKQWTGVLVVEIERLARGETIDQGIIARAFKYSKTLIVTPKKTFDPTNPFDAKFFEINLLFSRFEYEAITGRMQEGRLRAVKDGWYVANRPPYGYERIKHAGDKGFTLKPIPKQAEVVKMIYELYTTGELQADGTSKRLGVSLIVHRLNQLKTPTIKSDRWVPATVRDILINPVYIGKVRWNWRPADKAFNEVGNLTVKRPRATNDTWTIADGRHEAIIDPEVFELAQQFMKQNPARPVGERNTVKNPLSGLVICSMCKRRMTRRPYGKTGYPDTLMCQTPKCPCVSSHLNIVETKLLEALEDWLAEYKLQWNIGNKPKKTKNSMLDKFNKSLKDLNTEMDKLAKQQSSLDDLLEQGVYTVDKYKQRTQELEKRIKQVQDDRKVIEELIKTEETREVNRTLIIPTVERVIETYHALPTAQARNDLLKEVLEKVEYTKTKGGRWHNSPDDFKLRLFPKLPRSSYDK
ncbi:recombinase family protein [Candidatus Clostridium stratigraminis]|uniref:Recombinase family protein n=1 Tax=Candidatus Clostridium stratigraminis TaxID=3381661 RepID=A0ABW8T084_9CLOT